MPDNIAAVARVAVYMTSTARVVRPKLEINAEKAINIGPKAAWDVERLSHRYYIKKRAHTTPVGNMDA
jgi:hypothetical protein